MLPFYMVNHTTGLTFNKTLFLSRWNIPDYLGVKADSNIQTALFCMNYDRLRQTESEQDCENVGPTPKMSILTAWLTDELLAIHWIDLSDVFDWYYY